MPVLSIGHWRGIPLEVTLAVPIVSAALILLCVQSPSLLAGAIAWFAIVVVHELGHAIVAMQEGVEVLRIRIGALHGLVEHHSTGDPLRDARIAWAGPAFNLLIAVPTTFVWFNFETAFPALLRGGLAVLGPYQLGVALLNLMPTNGMDGTRIWPVLLSSRSRR